MTERKNPADLEKVVKEQADVIKKLEDEVKELKAQLESKTTLLKEQETKINTYSKNEQVLRLRDDLEIAHLIPRLRLCLQVFENNLQDYLFDSKTTMTKGEFLAAMIDKLHIEKNEDALIFANYFIPSDIEEIKTWKVLEKIIQIAGPYRSFKDNDFVKLKETFENANEKKKTQFIRRLSLLTNNSAEHMTSKNFTLFLQATDINFDRRAFIVLLLRKSQSISLISVFALKQVMYEILGHGDRPEKAELKKSDTSDEISQATFVNNIKRIIVTHKVAQAFKAQREKQKPKTKSRSKTIRKKPTFTKFIKAGIKSRIEKFIRGEQTRNPEITVSQQSSAL